MKRFRKIYLEISNICNLNCRFCPGTRRLPRQMDEKEFAAALDILRPWTDFLYFHVMGEPLCHPQLESFLRLAGKAGFRVILTTNGTLLSQFGQMLLNSPFLRPGRAGEKAGCLSALEPRRSGQPQSGNPSGAGICFSKALGRPAPGDPNRQPGVSGIRGPV